MKIPKNHPRYNSLMQRELIEDGVKRGIVTQTGMIAHGRGEAFDYLLGEKTNPEARKQIGAAAAMLVLAKRPVISVNGNATALCAKEIAGLAKAIPARIEANIFYPPEKRRKIIAREFAKLGAKILGTKPTKKIRGLGSARSNVDAEGIWKADVVLVMLEDGDRTEALRKSGKKVIAIDLNPLSRTAQKANIAIVDNITRAVPMLEKKAGEFRKKGEKLLRAKIKQFNNKKNLDSVLSRMRKGNTK